MPHMNEDSGERRRLMHRRSIECTGYLRNDGLWEVEARLVDTKPFAQRDHFRGEFQPGDPVHDIGVCLAVDDALTIREAETTMRATPFPTCVDVEPILQRLVGERIGPGWRDLGRRKIGGWRPAPTCRSCSARPSRHSTRRCLTARHRTGAVRSKISAAPASRRSFLAAVIPGEPMDPSSPSYFRNSRLRVLLTIEPGQFDGTRLSRAGWPRQA